METAQKIILEDANKILKNIGPTDAEIIKAYIEIQTQSKVKYKLMFESVLGGIGVISLLAGAAALLWIIGIAFYRGDAVSTYNRQMTELETRVQGVETTMQHLEDQNILIQKVKTMCTEFEEEY